MQKSIRSLGRMESRNEAGSRRGSGGAVANASRCSRELSMPLTRHHKGMKTEPTLTPGVGALREAPLQNDALLRSIEIEPTRRDQIFLCASVSLRLCVESLSLRLCVESFIF